MVDLALTRARRGPAVRLAQAALAAVALASAPGRADAHDFEPGVLVLEEVEPGRFAVSWAEPVDKQGAPSGVLVSFPEACERRDAALLCEAGLRGELSFSGLHETRTQVVVVARWLDGRSFEALVSGSAPRVHLTPGPGRDATAWIRLGVEHIALGYDHVAFVLGLLLVVGSSRRLVATITAFTLAHSITLALAATRVVTLPVRAVEASIALSVILVAREALSDRPTLTRTRPYLVAFLFGLVHGLGFASALSELGLPHDGRAFALAFFNVGVELGQLAIVAIAAACALAVTRLAGGTNKPRRAIAYAIGGLGAALLFDRVAGMVTG